nr:hypothetical protein [Spirochaetales bacterium]
MKNTKMIMSLLLVVVMLAGCTTYSLYIPPDTRDGLTFFPLEKADRGKKVYFGSWSASLNRGFGFGVDMSHVVAVSGKARQFSFIQYQDGTKAADVEGIYEY